jgi:hypothetical protein
MVRRVLLALTILAGLFIFVVPTRAPAGAGTPEMAPVMRYDACGNGRGCSWPGPAGGTCNVNIADCCNAFQSYHVYDLGYNNAWNILQLLYEPGFAQNCRDTLKVYVSPPPCECPGGNWTLIYQVATKTLASPAGAWYIYQRNLNRATAMYPWPAQFQCVKSELPVCFNDDGEVIAK